MLIGRLLTVGVLGTVLSLVPQSSASITAYNSPFQQGNQRYTGSLGLDFNVLAEPIEILSLGAFDSNGDGFNRPVSVSIYNRQTQALLHPFVTFTGALDPLVNGSRFRILMTPLILGPRQYSVVAYGYGPGELNGNSGCVGYGGGGCVALNPFMASTTNNGGGLINYVGMARYSPLTGVYPTQVDTGPANRYNAGTFTYQAVIPEPATIGLTAVALLGLGIRLRRRKA